MKTQLESVLHDAVITLCKTSTNQSNTDNSVHKAIKIVLTRPKQQQHGDYSCNIALQLAKQFAMPPRKVAEQVIKLACWPTSVSKTEIAGPGFINIYLHHDVRTQVLQTILTAGTAYGQAKAENNSNKQNKRICLEYVSANPTGPMHVGHGRGAVIGDALGSVLIAAGYEVHREYYINDAGAQIDVLAQSLWLRLRELAGETIEMPENTYPGKYIQVAAQQWLQQGGNMAELQNMADNDRNALLRTWGVAAMMAIVREDLQAIGIKFDNFFSEHSLHDAGSITKLIEQLKEQRLAYIGKLPPPKGKEDSDYKSRPQLLFRTTDFGDDIDRPLQRADGMPTYFAADIAYHADKHARGFATLIDVWGADHGGYVTRVQAAMQALIGVSKQPEVLLVQMVNLNRDGVPVRMSKRAGTFVTLREVVDEVGKDAVRFNFLTRRAESQLDFDLETAKKRSDENPVYYVQYAHARSASILRRLDADNITVDINLADTSLLNNAEENKIILQLAAYPELIQKAAATREPYRVAIWLMQFAALFHTWYHKHRVLDEKITVEHRHARAILVQAAKQVLANGLNLLGVSPSESM
ncbi:MAG: arginine--tRNA ligase [Mariprofundales bacterium]